MHSQGGVVNREHRPNVGIDVSKQHLDVCLGADHQRVLNDADGWGGLTRRFKEAGVDLIVIEATGGYERDLVWALQSAGMTVARVNPRQSHDFAKSMGELSKYRQGRCAHAAGLCRRARSPQRPRQVHHPAGGRTAPGAGAVDDAPVASSWRCVWPSRIGWSRPEVARCAASSW